jgi:hypothetical protein
MKWTGATASALVLLAWLLSGWLIFGVFLYSSRYHTWVCKVVVGRLEVDGGFDPDGAGPDSWRGPAVVRMNYPLWRWRFLYDKAYYPAGGWRCNLAIPLWASFCVLLVPTIWLFYRDRRRVRWSREGRCVGCGYDLSGVSGKCPECGREQPSEPKPATPNESEPHPH